MGLTPLGEVSSQLCEEAHSSLNQLASHLRGLPAYEAAQLCA